MCTVLSLGELVQAGHAEVEVQLTSHLLKQRQQLQEAVAAVDLPRLRCAVVALGTVDTWLHVD